MTNTAADADSTPKSNWSVVDRTRNILTASRTDGAFVQRIGGGKRSWAARGPQKNDWLRGKMFADSRPGTGALRCFGTAEAAMRAVDKEWPLS